MNETLYIPKKLNVGFVNRSDTYNNKLGYVIYWDDKNKLRKETSWQNWRDKSIDPEVYDNVPTSGFVINRQVGGARSGYYSWDARIEKVRVWDPRGFEFEISIPNLLFILQESNSMKGKGLEGEFVYSWAGPELVLLPVDTTEYKKCMEYTDLQAVKITKDSMIPGCTYKFKDNQECVYLGRLDYFTVHSHEVDNLYSQYRYDKKITEYTYQKCEKKHIFVNVKDLQKTNNISYRIESGFTKVGQVITTEPLDNYAELLDVYKSQNTGGKITGIKLVESDIDPSFIDKSNWRNYVNLSLGDNIALRVCVSSGSSGYYFSYTTEIKFVELDNGIYKKYDIYFNSDRNNKLRKHIDINAKVNDILTNMGVKNSFDRNRGYDYMSKKKMIELLSKFKQAKYMVTNEYNHEYELNF